MILGVMSDTHGNHELMLAAAAEMTDMRRAEAIFHLGDDYADGLALARAGYDVRHVPGLWCPEYHDSRIPKRLVEDFDGVTVVCLHAEKDLRAIDRAADVVLLGHTHAALAAVLGRTLYLNPGHLQSRVSRNQRASYGILTIGATSIDATIYDFASGEPAKECQLPR